MYPSADQTICLGESVDLEVFLADGNSTWTDTGLNATTGDQVTATPPTAGTYTVTSNPMTTSCGSSGTESFDITAVVSEPPSINLSAGACNASREIMVRASGGTSYHGSQILI